MRTRSVDLLDLVPVLVLDVDAPLAVQDHGGLASSSFSALLVLALLFGVAGDAIILFDKSSIGILCICGYADRSRHAQCCSSSCCWGGTIFGYPSAVFGGAFKSCQIVLYPPQVTSEEVCSERCVEQ